MTHGDTSFLTVNIDKDKAVNELIDGFDAESVPGHLVADRLDSAGYSLALQMETDASAELVTGGTAMDLSLIHISPCCRSSSTAAAAC